MKCKQVFYLLYLLGHSLNGANQLLEALNKKPEMIMCSASFATGIVAGLTTYHLCKHYIQEHYDESFNCVFSLIVGISIFVRVKYWISLIYWYKLGQVAKAFLNGKTFDNFHPKNGREWLLVAAAKAVRENRVDLFKKIISFNDKAVPVEINNFSLMPYIMRIYNQNPSADLINCLQYMIANRGSDFTQQTLKTSYCIDHNTILPSIIRNLLQKETINKFVGAAIDAILEDSRSCYDLISSVLLPIAKSKGHLIDLSNRKELINLSTQDPAFASIIRYLPEPKQTILEILRDLFFHGKSEAFLKNNLLIILKFI